MIKTYSCFRGEIIYIASVLACATMLQACGGSGSSNASPQAASSAPASFAGGATGPATASPRSQWQPTAPNTWQWQLRGPIDTSYNVTIYDVDLFDVDMPTLTTLKAAGRKVVCYFSAGSGEDWRPDYSKFTSADLGSALQGWPGERWLDVRSSNVRSVMSSRLDLAAAKGCDGVEPDNVDGFLNSTGFPLTAQDQIDFNTFLAQQAHARNLAVALKNDIEQTPALAKSFDFAVNEQCHEKGECAFYAAFTSDNKPVLNAEYARQYRDRTAQATLCQTAKSENIRTLVLPPQLDDTYRFSCD